MTELRTTIATWRSPNAMMAVLVGVVYLAVGVVGLAVRTGVAVAAS